MGMMASPDSAGWIREDRRGRKYPEPWPSLSRVGVLPFQRIGHEHAGQIGRAVTLEEGAYPFEVL